MADAQAKGIKFKDPRRVVGLMTRAFDPKTKKIYEGESGLRLQEKKLEEARWRERHGKSVVVDHRKGGL